MGRCICGYLAETIVLILFVSVVFRAVKQTLSGRECLYADGGLLDQYPIHMFDGTVVLIMPGQIVIWLLPACLFNYLTHTHTHTQPFYGSVEFVRDNPGEPVPEETFTPSHSSWSSIIPICFLHLLRSIWNSEKQRWRRAAILKMNSQSPKLLGWFWWNSVWWHILPPDRNGWF